ncbi:MAG: mrcB, partial [Thermoleophilia bacterium]|nr:mrcB [Thermoleophilia bacterium]
MRRAARFVTVTLRVVLYGTLLSVGVGAGLVTSAFPQLHALETRAETRENPGVVFARDNRTVLRKLRAPTSRTYLREDQVPRVLSQAVVAAEDRRFYEHGGIDPRGLIRALAADVRARSAVQGGSTITQQLVKNAYVGPSRSAGRKTREAALAIALETRWSKQRILTAYVNTAYFGDGYYGVYDASLGYFGVPVKRLRVDQAALLASLLRAPEGNSPSTSPDNARRARDRVLTNLVETGDITRAAADFARTRPLPSKAQLARRRSFAAKELAPQFTDAVVTRLIEHYGVRRATSGGLRVRTTLDARLQRAGTQAVQQAAELGLDAALVAVDVQSGEVRAMVNGGSSARSAFNVALDGHRQPGSAFKPFMLTAAYEQGATPKTRVESAPFSQQFDGTEFTVKNDGGYSGLTTIERATWKSDNTVYARLQEKYGIQAAIDAARAAGVQSNIDPVPATVL